ncbi:MAG: ribosomal-protein-alanine N-acetyltransferase [Alphaproteobacteria bacterium]
MTRGAPFQVEVVANSPAVAEALAELHAICFAGSPQENWSDSALSTLLDTPATIGAIVLGDGGGALGFIIGRAIADEGEVLTLCVSPAARRQGIATALMVKLQELLAPRRRIILEVAITNRPARDLYQSLGFREVGRRPAYYRRGGKAGDALILARGKTDDVGAIT